MASAAVDFRKFTMQKAQSLKRYSGDRARDYDIILHAVTIPPTKDDPKYLPVMFYKEFPVMDKIKEQFYKVSEDRRTMRATVINRRKVAEKTWEEDFNPADNTCTYEIGQTVRIATKSKDNSFANIPPFSLVKIINFHLRCNYASTTEPPFFQEVCSDATIESSASPKQILDIVYGMNLTKSFFPIIDFTECRLRVNDEMRRMGKSLGTATAASAPAVAHDPSADNNSNNTDEAQTSTKAPPPSSTTKKFDPVDTMKYIIPCEYRSFFSAGTLMPAYEEFPENMNPEDLEEGGHLVAYSAPKFEDKFVAEAQNKKEFIVAEYTQSVTMAQRSGGEVKFAGATLNMSVVGAHAAQLLNISDIDLYKAFAPKHVPRMANRFACTFPMGKCFSIGENENAYVTREMILRGYSALVMSDLARYICKSALLVNIDVAMNRLNAITCKTGQDVLSIKGKLNMKDYNDFIIGHFEKNRQNATSHDRQLVINLMESKVYDDIDLLDEKFDFYLLCDNQFLTESLVDELKAMEGGFDDAKKVFSDIMSGDDARVDEGYNRLGNKCGRKLGSPENAPNVLVYAVNKTFSAKHNPFLSSSSDDDAETDGDDDDGAPASKKARLE